MVWIPGSPAACWSILEQDTEPQLASDEQVGTLHGGLSIQCMKV